MQILAKDYTQRSDLDNYVRNEIGEDIPQNRKDGHTIEGTEEELKNLGLGDSSRIYGVKCVIIQE